MVRSSPWCRCLDTARLAFGRADAWAALGSTYVDSAATNDLALRELRQALAATAARRDGFDVWVTHDFVLAALVGGSCASGEGLVLRSDPHGTPRLLGTIVP